MQNDDYTETMAHTKSAAQAHKLERALWQNKSALAAHMCCLSL